VDPLIGFKLVLAAVLGGLIGIERQIRGKPAGLRTNMLICMGATQFMVISMKVGDMFGEDHTRIAAQIITGIGFLGAGAVLHSHGFVLGLTTAATIWVVAGVGMALGAGMYWTAVEVTVLAIVTLYLLGFLERYFDGRTALQFRLVVESLNPALDAIHRVLHEAGAAPSDLSFKREGNHYRLWFRTTAPHEINHRILDSLARESGIIEVETVVQPIRMPE
jgi:putative Mg2+ transporter-C (MgtC) family protein